MEYGSNIFRIFCCFDQGNLVVLFNGFQKKTQKTPELELNLAKRLMKEYFDLRTQANEKQRRDKKAKTFEELLNAKYGVIGTPVRDRYEAKADAFVISQMLKEARKEAHMTQEELARKSGTPISHISELENGKCDVNLSTLFRIFETGLGKEIRLTIL